MREHTPGAPDVPFETPGMIWAMRLGNFLVPSVRWFAHRVYGPVYAQWAFSVAALMLTANKNLPTLVSHLGTVPPRWHASLALLMMAQRAHMKHRSRRRSVRRLAVTLPAVVTELEQESRDRVQHLQAVNAWVVTACLAWVFMAAYGVAGILLAWLFATVPHLAGLTVSLAQATDEDYRDRRRCQLAGAYPLDGLHANEVNGPYGSIILERLHLDAETAELLCAMAQQKPHEDLLTMAAAVMPSPA